jgi:hypothetical protein
MHPGKGGSASRRLSFIDVLIDVLHFLHSAEISAETGIPQHLDEVGTISAIAAKIILLGWIVEFPSRPP